MQSAGRTIDPFAQHPLHRATTVQAIERRAPLTFDLIAPSDQCERPGEPVEYLEGERLAHFLRGALHSVNGEQAWQLLTPSSLDPLVARRTSSIPHDLTDASRVTYDDEVTCMWLCSGVVQSAGSDPGG